MYYRRNCLYKNKYKNIFCKERRMIVLYYLLISTNKQIKTKKFFNVDNEIV